MSYWDAARLAQDPDVRERIAACAAIEGVESPAPNAWAQEQQWRLAGTAGWADVYADALDAGVTRPGRDETVITDEMIRAAVVAIIAPDVN